MVWCLDVDPLGDEELHGDVRHCFFFVCFYFLCKSVEVQVSV